jgi:Uma2 family endonuclease
MTTASVGQPTQHVIGHDCTYPVDASQVRDYRWTVRQYDRLTVKGFFDRVHVELIEGRIIKMAPKWEPHVAGVSLTAKAIERAFGEGYWVRRESPLHFGTRSKPEADLAVVVGTENDYVNSGAPSNALLVVEVSESSLKYDRGRKASLYARNGIADYWIVNIVDRQLEIHRQSIADPLSRFRFRYSQIQTLKPGESATPLAVGSAVAVSAMFPAPRPS